MPVITSSTRTGVWATLLAFRGKRPRAEPAEIHGPFQRILALHRPAGLDVEARALRVGREAELDLLALDRPGQISLAEHLRRIMARELFAVLFQRDRRLARAAVGLHREHPFSRQVDLRALRGQRP